MGFWKGMRVLVTGAGGFIGSHLCQALDKEGAKVNGFLHYNSRGSVGFLKDSGIDHEFGDVADGIVTDKHFIPDLVFHLAAIISVPYSQTNPKHVWRTNTEGTRAALEYAHSRGAWFVHTSTSEVYGTPKSVPITIEHPMNPQSPYAASKVAADALVNAWVHTFGANAITVRPFNTYGPRQSPRAVIPTILGQMAKKQDVELGNLDAKRDFTFVSDTVRGMMLAAENAAVGSVTQLGTGKSVSIGELASLCAKVSGSKRKILQDKSRTRPNTSEVNILESDYLTAKYIGWEPQVSLEDGLRKTWEWIKEHGTGAWDPSRYNI